MQRRLRHIRYLTHVSFNKKVRRHSGRVFGATTIKAKYKWIIDNCLEPQEYWDDWTDYRDGLRNWYADKSKIKNHRHRKRCESCCEVEKNNKKLKLLLKRRDAMKRGRSAIWLTHTADVRDNPSSNLGASLVRE
jgi:hypothetical protein